MNSYKIIILENGKIIVYSEEDCKKAVKQGKEILFICGYEYIIIGGNIKDGEISLYTKKLKNMDLKVKDTKKYEIIATEGISVYMETGNLASVYHFGKFFDNTTPYFADDDKFIRFEKFQKFKEMSEEIDLEKTLKMIKGENEKDTVKIKDVVKDCLRYLMVYSVDDNL